MVVAVRAEWLDEEFLLAAARYRERLMCALTGGRLDISAAAIAYSDVNP